MSNTYLSFKREGLCGTVPVGSYLSDVFRRFGIRFENGCDRSNGFHACEVTINEGAGLLSNLTKVEMEHFSKSGRRINRRLICEARIIKPGEIEIMTDETKKAPSKEEPQKDKFQQEFEALPLEKKIASLLRMEALTLGETFTYVVNSPMKVVEKVGDVIAEFGIRLETEARKASRPAATDPSPDSPKASAAKPRPKTSRKPSPPSPAKG